MTPARVAWLLFGGAAVIRVAYVLAVADHPAVAIPIGDSLAYHRAALRILGGDWIGSEVFYQDPLYPYWLAALYAVFGVGSIAVPIAQALVDAVSVVLVYWTARELFGDRTAWIAGASAALYRVSWFYDAVLLKVPLTLLLASLTALLLARAERRGSARAWGAAAFALGLAALTRGNYLVFAPVLLGWAIARAPGARVRSAGAVALGLALAIGPVALRNWLVADDFVLITSQAGQNFYIGNARDNASGVYKAPAFVVANAEHEQGDFRAEAQRRTGREMKPSELSRFWFAAAFDEIRADPAHFARHTWRKLGLFFNHYEVPDNQSFAFFAQRVAPLLAVPTPGFGVLVPLAIVGFAFARRERGAWLLAAFFACYAASVIGFFIVSRYRIPALPAVFVLAGHGASGLFERARERRWTALAASALALAGLLAFTHRSLIEEDFGLFRSNLAAALSRRAQAHDDAARERVGRGDADGAARERAEARTLWEAAEHQLRAGFEARSRDPLMRGWLKGFLDRRIAALRDAGELADALEVAERRAATFPRDASGFASVGELYEALGEPERARRAYTRALGIAPGHRGARQGMVRLRAAPGAPP